MKPLFAFILLLAVPLLPAQDSGVQSPALTDADEIRIGRVLADQFAKNQGIEATPQTEYFEGYLQTVGALVAAHAHRKLPYRFHFDPNPRFKSAIGLPGGEVFVGGGILAYTDTEDQLAMILGHEIEHIDLNHCRDRIIKIMADQQLAPTDAAKFHIEDFIPGYGRDNELAADREGVKLSVAAGYSAQAGVRLLQTFLILAQQAPHSPGQGPTDGEKAIQERIAQMQVIVKSKVQPPDETPFALR